MSRAPNDSGGPVTGTAAKSAAAKLTDLPEMVRPTTDTSCVRHVLAVAYCIRGTRGRLSQLWIVRRCPYCTETHRHQARPDALQGKRTASCHGGKYLVIAAVVPGQVAA